MASGEVLRVLARVELDWSDPTHRATTEADCRICGGPTRERDGQDRPADKRCVETELAAERAGLAVDARLPRPARPRILS
jgi:hypothetical protein